ncbi:hypothetical protein BT69DRAFT_1238823, partial [Atractiella rhizophila]
MQALSVPPSGPLAVDGGQPISLPATQVNLSQIQEMPTTTLPAEEMPQPQGSGGDGYLSVIAPENETLGNGIADRNGSFSHVVSAQEGSGTMRESSQHEELPHPSYATPSRPLPPSQTTFSHTTMGSPSAVNIPPFQPPTPMSLDSRSPPTSIPYPGPNVLHQHQQPLPPPSVQGGGNGYPYQAPASASLPHGQPHAPAQAAAGLASPVSAAAPARMPSNTSTKSVTSSRLQREEDESSSDSSDSSSEESYSEEDSTTQKRVRKRRKRPLPIDPETGKELPRIRPAYYYDSSYVPSYPHPRRPADLPPKDPAHKWTKKGKPPHSQRGIPVFMPSMEEFSDFYTFIKAVDRYGMKSGIVKVIPPEEWKDSLPSVREPLKNVRIREPISQTVIGNAGTYKYTNIAKSKQYNAKMFKELSETPAHRPPDFFKLGRKEEKKKPRRSRAKVEVKEEEEAEEEKKDEEDVIMREPDSKEETTVAQSQEKEEEPSSGAVTTVVQPAAEETVTAPEPMEVDRPASATSIDATSAEAGGTIASDSQSHESVLPPASTTGTAVMATDTMPALPEGLTPSLLSQIAASLPRDLASGSQHIPASASSDANIEPSLLPLGSEGQAVDTTTGSTQPEKKRAKRKTQAELTEIDDAEWAVWDFESLPYGATKEQYSQEACRDVERTYWRTLTLNDTPAMYGADLKGSLFTDETKEWNVAHLESFLTELLPRARKQIPGVNTPYLYFGMWKATFAWHVEDCDLYSINYLHFGAPKFWYAIPQGKGDENGGAGGGMGGKDRFERVMASMFPGQDKTCSQFLRHKAFSVSPTKLAEHGIKLNRCVQLPGEFMLTYPNGYHSGFNTGFNCAESVNFATKAWLELGRKAQSCRCMSDSVSINVDAMLADNAEWLERQKLKASQASKKRSHPSSVSNASRASSVAVTPLPSHEQHGQPQKRFKVETGPPNGSYLPGQYPSPQPPHVQYHHQQQQAMSVMHQAQPSQRSQPMHPQTQNARPAGYPQAPRPQQPRQVGQQFDAQQPSQPLQQQTMMPPPPPAKPAPPPKKDYICALCPDLADDHLVPIREPGKKSTGNEKKAHRVCVTFTPATWIEFDPIAKEDVVRGFNQIERARWTLKCGLCNEKHGAPVQCTKGKCVRAFHATCALQDGSGVVLDAIIGEGDNARSLIVEPAKPESNSNGAATAPDLSQASGELRTVILCRQHNPDWKKLEAERKANELQIKIDTLQLDSRIRVKTGGGAFEVKLKAINRDAKTVIVEFDDGQKSEFKYPTVQFTQPKVAPVGKKRKKLDPDFIHEFEDDSDEDWVAEGRSKKRSKGKITINEPPRRSTSQSVQPPPMAPTPVYPPPMQNAHYYGNPNSYYNYPQPPQGVQAPQMPAGYTHYGYSAQPHQTQMAHQSGPMRHPYSTSTTAQPPHSHPQTLPGIANLLSAAGQQPQQQFVPQVSFASTSQPQGAYTSNQQTYLPVPSVPQPAYTSSVQASIATMPPQQNYGSAPPVQIPQQAYATTSVTNAPHLTYATATSPATTLKYEAPMQVENMAPSSIPNVGENSAST